MVRGDVVDSSPTFIFMIKGGGVCGVLDEESGRGGKSSDEKK